MSSMQINRFTVVAALLFSRPAFTQRLLTPADINRFPEVTECALSPDGRTVAIVTPPGSIQLFRTDGTGSRTLTDGKIRPASLRWSPDGKKLAFFGSGPGADLWAMDVGSSALTPVANVVHSNFWLPEVGSGLEWSPDSRQLAFVAADPSIPPQQADPRAITRLQFKSRTDFSDDRREHIWVVDAGGGKPRALTSGNYNEHSITWSGRTIAFISNRQPDPDAIHNYDLFTVNVDSGEVRRLTDTPGCEYGPVFSPDGRSIAYTATTRAITTVDSVAEDAHVWVIAAAGGRPRELNHALDRRSSSPRWAADGRSVYFLAEDRGRQLIYRVPSEGGAAQPLFDKNANVPAYAVGRKTAYLMNDDRRIAELYADGKQLTGNSKTLAEFRISEPVRFEFSSFDSTPVEAWLLPPADRVEWRKYPLVLSIHGGPHSMFHYSFGRNLRMQILAAAGYAVLYVNPRGSSGYGQKFSDGCVNDWGGGDYKDLMAAVDQALERFPWLDRDRMAVMGSSYGGYMTNWAITQTARFHAALAFSSISNLISFYGTSLYQDLIHAEFGGFPWENGNYERLWDRSPLKYVANVRTPTLFIHGERDHDVDISDAEQMYEALRRRGVEAALIRYPGEGHGFLAISRRGDVATKRSHEADAMEKTITWLHKHLE